MAAAAAMGGGDLQQQETTVVAAAGTEKQLTRKKVGTGGGRRGRREMRRIEDATSRQVTFSKRRSGLLKKAFELSVLCDAEVALIVFSPRGRLYEFASASSDLQKTIDRYLNHTKNSSAHEKGDESCVQKWRSEATLEKKIEAIEGYKSKLLGEGLGSCSVQELQELEVQLEKSLCSIRQKKQKMLMDQILELREKEMNLLKENMVLRDQCKALSSPWSSVVELKNKQADDHRRHEDYSSGGGVRDDDRRILMDVETDLVIGRPGSMNDRAALAN